MKCSVPDCDNDNCVAYNEATGHICEKPEVKSKLVANKAPDVEPKYHRPLFNMNFCNDTNGFCHD